MKTGLSVSVGNVWKKQVENSTIKCENFYYYPERHSDRERERERERFYLTRLSTASYKMLVGDSLKHEVAALVERSRQGQEPKYSEENLNRNRSVRPTRTGPGSNPGLWDERPASNCFTHFTLRLYIQLLVHCTDIAAGKQYRCIVPKVVYTVKKCSWRWASLSPETCRGKFYFCISVHRSISQIKHLLDATLCKFYFCRVTLHVSGVKRPSSGELKNWQGGPWYRCSVKYTTYWH